jgi:hypothetical protein
MAFIGNTNTTQAFTPAVDFFSGNASTTAFTLSRPVASVAQVQAVVNNVAQNPSDAFTISGNTITFTSAPSSGTNNIYVYYTSPITQVIAPGQSTVGTTQLQGGLTVNFADGTAAAPSITNDGDTNTGIFFPAADTIAFAEGGVESMRINSSGYVLVGCTALPSSSVAGASLSPSVTSVNPHFFSAGSATGSVAQINFINGNGTVGQISTSGSGTTYATSSDYRLKENVVPMQNALGVVTQLKPVIYNWKVDGSSGQGFIAHELQEVVPDCVTGVKDAVDAEGNPQYQGIDTSFLVATLTAAIQEQQALITALTARITALENK